MEGDGLGLHLALLNVDLVAAKNDGNVLADTDEITCPGVSSGSMGVLRRASEAMGGVTYGASWGRSCR